MTNSVLSVQSEYPVSILRKSISGRHRPIRVDRIKFMLSMLGKSFNRQHFEIFFLISPRKQALTFFANCLLKMTRPFFLGKIIKNHQFGKIWQSAEFAHRAVKVTKMSATGLLPKQTKYLFNQKLNYVQYHINVLC